MAKTKIEWVEYSINPIRAGKGKSWPSGTHCTKISIGCNHCFAEPLNIRFGNGLPYDNTPTKFHLDLSVFDTLPKTKSVSVFVQSMSDLFHEDVPDEFIHRVFSKMHWSDYHIKFLVLTKRIERAVNIIPSILKRYSGRLPMPNLWLGVSIEHPKYLWRIDELLKIKAAVRFVSFEPLLGDVGEIIKYLGYKVWCDEYHRHTKRCLVPTREPKLDWVIVGAESGRKWRECKIESVRNIVRQCKDAGVPCFVKQLHIHPFGHNDYKPFGGILSKNMAEWPEDLRVQEYPQ